MALFESRTPAGRLLCPLKCRGSDLLPPRPGGRPRDPLPLHDKRPSSVEDTGACRDVGSRASQHPSCGIDTRARPHCDAARMVVYDIMSQAARLVGSGSGLCHPNPMKRVLGHGKDYPHGSCL
jgi:hypothetical protein